MRIVPNFEMFLESMNNMNESKNNIIKSTENGVDIYYPKNYSDVLELCKTEFKGIIKKDYSEGFYYAQSPYFFFRKVCLGSEVVFMVKKGEAMYSISVPHDTVDMYIDDVYMVDTNDKETNSIDEINSILGIDIEKILLKHKVKFNNQKLCVDSFILSKPTFVSRGLVFDNYTNIEFNGMFNEVPLEYINNCRKSEVITFDCESIIFNNLIDNQLPSIMKDVIIKGDLEIKDELNSLKNLPSKVTGTLTTSISDESFLDELKKICKKVIIK